jgi:hypothetical protein
MPGLSCSSAMGAPLCSTPFNHPTLFTEMPSRLVFSETQASSPTEVSARCCWMRLWRKRTPPPTRRKICRSIPHSRKSAGRGGRLPTLERRRCATFCTTTNLPPLRSPKTSPPISPPTSHPKLRPSNTSPVTSPPASPKNKYNVLGNPSAKRKERALGKTPALRTP